VRFGGTVVIWLRMSGFGPRFVAVWNRCPAKRTLDEHAGTVHGSFVTCERPTSPQADPARHEPSETRPANCTCCGGTRQPDPTDDFIVMLKEYAQLDMRLARVAVTAAEEEDARLAAAPVPAAAPAEPAVEAASAAEDPAAGKRAAERRTALKSADLAYSRAGRSMRLSMQLAIKFHDDRLERDKKIDSVAVDAERTRKNRVKGRLRRLATDAIKRHTEREIERQLEAEEIEEVDEEAKEDALDSLYEALSERLDEEDIERDLDICPTSELFGRICQDLGVEPDWERLGRAFWALEEIRRNVPGSRFTGPPPAEPEPAEMPEARPEPQAAEPAAAKPEAPPAPPVRSNMDRLRYPTQDEIRAEEERKARIRALHPLDSG
jgi:hypothetical protein